MKSVGENAFTGNPWLVAIYFGEGIEEIRLNACQGCNALTEISLPSTLKVYYGALERCDNVTSLVFNEGLEELRASWCYGCDGLVGVIAVSSVLYNLLYVPQDVVDMLFGAAVGFAVMMLIFIISRGGMGGGDVKLSGAVGLWLGVEGTLLFLLLAFIMGGVLSLLLLVSGVKSKGEAIPFGPFLCLAAFVTVLYQPFLLNFYWQLFLF